MPGQSSADEEPKNQNPKETGEAIPEPSPGVEPKADNSWGKEESTPGAASESAQSKVIEIHNSPTGQERSNQEMTWAVIAH